VKSQTNKQNSISQLLNLPNAEIIKKNTSSLSPNDIQKISVVKKPNPSNIQTQNEISNFKSKSWNRICSKK
jgi:hypothetical protein